VGLVNINEFLLSDPNWKEPPIQILGRFREQIEELPETAATFKMKDYLRPRTIDLFGDRLADYIGSWRIPQQYAPAYQQGRVYVNPNYIHAHTYPGVYTECECGNIQVHPQPKDSVVDPPIDGANEHGDCKPYHRMEVKAELMRQREECITQQVMNGVERTYISRRIGFKGDHVNHAAKRLGISLEHLRQKFIDERGEAIVELAKRGWSTTKIAKAYGLSRGHVYKQIREYGEAKPSEITEAKA
jgi:hypothetical protein